MNEVFIRLEKFCWIFVATFLLCIFTVVPARADEGFLYGADDTTGTCIVIDLKERTVRAIGGNIAQLRKSGFPEVMGLAYDIKNRILYGVDSEKDQILTIDTKTGAGKGIGSAGQLSAAGFDYVHGLAYDPHSRILYGVDRKNFQILAIDPATGRARGIGRPSQLYDDKFSGVSSLAFDPETRTLFGADSFSGFGSRGLIRIDTTNGSASMVGNIIREFQTRSLTFSPLSGKIHGLNVNSGWVLDIKTQNGSFTKTIQFSNYKFAEGYDQVEGLAFAPTVPDTPAPQIETSSNKPPMVTTPPGNPVVRISPRYPPALYKTDPGMWRTLVRNTPELPVQNLVGTWESVPKEEALGYLQEIVMMHWVGKVNSTGQVSREAIQQSLARVGKNKHIVRYHELTMNFAESGEFEGNLLDGGPKSDFTGIWSFNGSNGFVISIQGNRPPILLKDLRYIVKDRLIYSDSNFLNLVVLQKRE